MKTLMEKEIYEQPEVLSRIEKTNEDTLNTLVEKVTAENPAFAYFAARGTSDHASIYASYLMGIYKGIPSGLALPSAVTVYNGALCLKNSLVIGVSQSGKAEDARNIMQRGKECGSTVMAVTNDLSSPMAKQADYHLYCDAGEEKSVAATKTFTSEMYNLALFTAKWAKNDELLSKLRELPDILSRMLDEVAPQIDNIISRYRFMQEGFILSRGLTYPVALEACLKLQETNYVKMKGYAMSDFYHGPFAQLENGTPVFLYANDGACIKNSFEMLERLDSVGTDTLIVSDNEEIIKNRPLAIKLPSTGSDAVSPFLFAAFAQLFACKLTAVKGLNPDAPRNLKKVTVTV